MAGGGGPGAGRRGGLLVDEDERRVLGMPLRWFGGARRLDLRPLRHPLAFLRWRRERHRLGPYARSFTEVLSGRPSEAR